MDLKTLALISCALLATGVTSGAGIAQAAPGARPLQTITMTHGARTRTVHLAVPPAGRKGTLIPLVLALHGGSGQGKRFDQSTGADLRGEALRRGWLVAFPEGIAKGWNDGRSIPGRAAAARRGVDDVAFLAALIERLKRTHRVDPTRVYATGISNGGFMSIRLGIDLGAKIAAIAPVTANVSTVLSTRTPTHPMPVMFVNGTKDPLVPYEGGFVGVFGTRRGRVLSTDASVAWWCKHNTCTQPARTVPLRNVALLDGTRVQRVTHAGRAPVVLIRVQGGGHTWPGGTQYLPRVLVGRVSRDIQATKLIFDFFARHRRVAVGAARTAR